MLISISITTQLTYISTLQTIHLTDKEGEPRKVYQNTALHNKANTEQVETHVQTIDNAQFQSV